MKKRKVWILGVLSAYLLLAFGQAVRAEDETTADPPEEILETEETADIYQAGAFQAESSGIAVYSLQTEEMERQIYQSLSQVSAELSIADWGFTTDRADEIKAMFERVVNGHPELFYVSNKYSYRYTTSGSVIALVWNYQENDPGRIASMKSELETKVSEILSKTNSSMTDVEKLMLLHEALVVNTTYTETTQWSNGSGCYTAYGALVEGRAVCHGYTLAFDLLAERLGIQTEFVGSEGLNHAWNLVRLDGKTYHVDCTWDDPDQMGKVLHRNFMLSDSGIKSTGHTVWNDPGLSGDGTVYDDYYWRNPAYDYEFIISESVWYQIGRRGVPSEWWRRVGVSLLNPETLTPAPMKTEADPISVHYQAHVQSQGWQKQVSDGTMAGTNNKAKRLEAIKIEVSGNPDVGVSYQAHVQSLGWQKEVSDGALAGTENKAKRLEAVRIWLTGAEAGDYDIYYRVHVQSYGWLGWAKNGENAGTEGLAKRLEAIEIKVVEKGGSAPGSTEKPFVKAQPTVSYQTHVQSYGWQSQVSNGALSGTTGRAKRLEAIRVSLSNLSVSGGIRYRTHVQSQGWQGWKANGELSGTTNHAKRLEAIRIELTGALADQYDIYYRVHVQSYGWQDWVKNGEIAGTVGKAKRLEAIEIRLETKN